MSPAGTAAALLVPLALATLVMWPRARGAALAAAPWAPLPALLLALYGEDGRVEAPSLLLGALFGLDQTARTFLLFTALLWLVAGVYAQRYLAADTQRARFFVFFLATAVGNLGVVLAQDIASFYFFFALMTFAAYGLVVHEGTPAARRAGKVYLAMAVMGEVALLVGFLLLFDASGTLDLEQAAARSAGAPTATVIVGFLLAGFGVKVGALGVHLWLPLAYPLAPTPASAVLSGAMIKAGVLGWLRFLPLGEAALPELGMLVVMAGVAAALYGAAVGVTQREAKAVLAYSSIGQMGIMTAAIGVALLAPDLAGALMAALVFYALHHALAKGALFLGVGVARGATPGQRALVLAGLALPAAALAGAPLTSGVLAKGWLKQSLHGLAEPGLAWLDPLLSLATVGTTLLMARFLFVMHAEMKRSRTRRPGLALPWLAVLAAVAAAFGALPVSAPAAVYAYLWTGPALWSALWPLLLGGALALAALRARVTAPAIPPGDLLIPIERLLGRMREGWRAARAQVTWPAPMPMLRAPPGRAIAVLERRLRALPVVGGVLLLLLGLFAVLLALT